MKSTPRKTPPPSRTEPVSDPDPALPPLLIHGDVEIPEGYLTEADQRSLLGLPSAPRRTGRLAWLRPIGHADMEAPRRVVVAATNPPLAAPPSISGAGWSWRQVVTLPIGTPPELKPGLTWRSGDEMFFCYQTNDRSCLRFRCVRVQNLEGEWNFDIDSFESSFRALSELDRMEDIAQWVPSGQVGAALAAMSFLEIRHLGPGREETKGIFRQAGVDLNVLFASYRAFVREPAAVAVAEPVRTAIELREVERPAQLRPGLIWTSARSHGESPRTHFCFGVTPRSSYRYRTVCFRTEDNLPEWTCRFDAFTGIGNVDPSSGRWFEWENFAPITDNGLVDHTIMASSPTAEEIHRCFLEHGVDLLWLYAHYRMLNPW